MNSTASSNGHTPIITRSFNSGTQNVYRFPNGYGLSEVIGTLGSYGGHEVAVLRFTGEGVDNFDLCYSTPITDDVIGWVTDEDVARILDEVAALPNPAEVSA